MVRQKLGKNVLLVLSRKTRRNMSSYVEPSVETFQGNYGLAKISFSFCTDRNGWSLDSSGIG